MENDEIENISTNASGNRPFEDIMQHRISRRGAIGGGVAGAVAFFAGSSFSSGSVSANGLGGDNLGFTAIPPGTDDAVTLPDGYTGQVIAPWGDPIDGVSPPFNKDASNPTSHQERQMGQGHDGMHFYPLGKNKDSNKRGMLCINHEYTVGKFHYPDGLANWDAEKTAKEQAGHGVSVIEVVQKNDGSWKVVPSFRSRRITANTVCELTGPASGHRLVQTPGFPGGTKSRGILNQCGSGQDPLGHLPHHRRELQRLLLGRDRWHGSGYRRGTGGHQRALRRRRPGLPLPVGHHRLALPRRSATHQRQHVWLDGRDRSVRTGF